MNRKWQKKWKYRIYWLDHNTKIIIDANMKFYQKRKEFIWIFWQNDQRKPSGYVWQKFCGLFLTSFNLKPLGTLMYCPDYYPYHKCWSEKINPHLRQIYPFRKKIISENIHKGEYYEDGEKAIMFPLQNISDWKWKLRCNKFRGIWNKRTNGFWPFVINFTEFPPEELFFCKHYALII